MNEAFETTLFVMESLATVGIFFIGVGILVVIGMYIVHQ